MPVTIKRYLALYPQSVHLDCDLVMAESETFQMPIETRQMNCVFLGLCLNGSGSYTMSTVEHSFQKNDVVVVGEGQTLGDIHTSDDFEALTILISREMLDEVVADAKRISNLFVFALDNPILHLTTDEANTVIEYFAMMKRKVHDADHIFRREVVGTLLAAAIYDILNAVGRKRQIDNIRKSRSERVFNDFIALVEDNYREIRRVTWYSERIGLSSKALLETVKRVSNRTPNEWLAIYTMLEIRHLLRHTSMPIKDIAERMNFSNQGAMGKFFKERAGISPTDYRGF